MVVILVADVITLQDVFHFVLKCNILFYYECIKLANIINVLNGMYDPI